MSFSTPTDALSIQAHIITADASYAFDCLELSYESAIHSVYGLRALLVSDVAQFAWQSAASNIQLHQWVKIEVQSERFGTLVFAGKIYKTQGACQFANDKELVWIDCVPECYELFTNHRSGIYLGGSVLDMIQKGLVQRFQQLSYQNTTVKQSLSQNSSFYPIQNSITQFAESDLAFIFRHLSEYGIWANFRQDFSDKSGVNLQLGDHNAALNEFGPVDVLSKMNHEGAGLFDMNIETCPLVDTVRAIYFDESQNQYLMQTLQLGSRGVGSLDHHCLGNLLSTTDVNNIAHTVQDSIKVQEQVLTASFQGLNLQPGDIIEVPIAGSNIPYVICSLQYEFTKGDEDKSHAAQYGQKHRLKAYALIDHQDKSLTYRAPIWIPCHSGENPELKRQYPNYPYKGILSGCYGLPTGDIVVPDQIGNIPVQFPYHYTEVCGNVPARYTRVISLSNEGGTTGRTFPVYKDTELQVMFANGNMDFPLIKGAAANTATGHVHNSSVQNRTHYALPQGQYLTYSNVPGDHNFVAAGASHSEGSARTFSMLSNHQDPNNPGTKKLDSQVITNQSYEQTTAGDKHSRQAGGSNVINGQTKIAPVTSIQFIIGDQTNIHNPTVAPMLDDYLQGISADITLTQNGTEQSIPSKATTLQKNLYLITQILSPTADPSVPVNVSQVQIQLSHNGRNGTDTSMAVNIIAQNTKPIFPTDTVTLQPSDWQQNKQVDQYGNITYTVNLNLLAPAFLFNFRQDFYAANHKLTGEDKDFYDSLSPYFQAETYKSKSVLKEAFSKHELDFFETMGNNVTLFIHGYNVGYGGYPINLVHNPDNVTTPFVAQGTCTLYRDPEFLKAKYGSNYKEYFTEFLSLAKEELELDQKGKGDPDSSKTNPDSIDLMEYQNVQDMLYGSEAHKWLMCIEHHLNVGAGFDGNDYSKFSRIVGISWQGNPETLDFMASVANNKFAAQKIFALVEQLQSRGVKVDIAAHSMGNGVLTEVLELCGKAGKPINQAFFWQAAVPNNILDGKNTETIPMVLMGKNNQVVQIPIPDAYPNAQKGAESFSILFSNDDTILGNIAAQPSQKTWTAETIYDFYVGLFGNHSFEAKVATSVGQALLNTFHLALNPSVKEIRQIEADDAASSEASDNTAAGMILHNAIYDPGAGLMFAVPGEAMLILDNYGLPHISAQLQSISIYHIANLFTEPLSFFLGGIPNIQAFYTYWAGYYETYMLPLNGGENIVSKKFYPDFNTQTGYLQSMLPDVYNFIAVGAYCALYVMQQFGAGRDDSIWEKARMAIHDCAELIEWVHNGEPYFNPPGKMGDQAKAFATLILSILLTDKAVVPPALGYTGVPSSDPLYNDPRINQSAQKDPSGKDLCVDHSAMLFPTPDFMEYIYKGVLMGGQPTSFKQFGKWPLK